MTDKNKPVMNDPKNPEAAVKEPALFKEPSSPKKGFNFIWILLITVLAYFLWPKGYIEGVGIVNAERLVQLGLTSSGILKGVFYKEGDAVNQGDLLAKFRNPDLERQYAEKKAALEILNHDLSLLKKKKEFQVKEKQRKNLLAENGAIGLVELEIAALELSEREEEIAIKEKEVISLEKTMALLKERVESLELKAPFSGTLLNDPRQRVGNFLKEGDFVMALVDPLSFYLELTVSEKNVERLSIGNRANVNFKAIPLKSYTGRISRIGPKTQEEVEKVFKVRHVIPVEIQLEGVPASIKYGMRAQVRITPHKNSHVEKGKDQLSIDPMRAKPEDESAKVPVIGK